MRFIGSNETILTNTRIWLYQIDYKEIYCLGNKLVLF
nr:MAG TPA: hypothetical protein [Bacteriophage sp.]